MKRTRKKEARRGFRAKVALAAIKGDRTVAELASALGFTPARPAPGRSSCSTARLCERSTRRAATVATDRTMALDSQSPIQACPCAGREQPVHQRRLRWRPEATRGHRSAWAAKAVARKEFCRAAVARWSTSTPMRQGPRPKPALDPGRASTTSNASTSVSAIARRAEFTRKAC